MKHRNEGFFEKLFHPQVFGERVMQRRLHAGQFVANMCPHPRQYRSCGRGFGKSTGLITDMIARRATLLPHIRAIKMGIEQPLPYKALIAASTKEQAFEIQTSLRQKFEASDVLADELALNKTTKTNIVLRDGQRIMVRPATASARGLHPETVIIRGAEVKGTFDAAMDEFAFFANDDFFKSVLKPMFSVADPYTSLVTLNSTPFGEIGESYELLQQAGPCMQKFKVELNESTGHVDVHVKFDKEICKVCMAKNRFVKFQFPTYWNPFADQAAILEEKEVLYAAGLQSVYDSEYEGIPTSTAGLFFTKEIHERVWQPELPEFRLNSDGAFVMLDVGFDSDDGTKIAVEIFVDLEKLRRRRGRRFLGIDPNSGLQVKRADYAAIAVVEENGNDVDLLLCERWKIPPPLFNNLYFQATEITPFMIAYGMFLMDVFGCHQGYCDANGGGAGIIIPMQQKYGDKRFIAVPGSEQAKNESLLHTRSLMMQNRFHAPPIRFLVDETKFLRVNMDTLTQHDKLKVEKAAAHGTAGAEVDGWMAIAYACRGTIGRSGVNVSISSQLPGMSQGHMPFYTPLQTMLNKFGKR